MKNWTPRADFGGKMTELSNDRAREDYIHPFIDEHERGVEPEEEE